MSLQRVISGGSSTFRAAVDRPATWAIDQPTSVASPIRCRRLRAAIGAQRKAHRAAHTELYWQAIQRPPPPLGAPPPPGAGGRPPPAGRRGRPTAPPIPGFFGKGSNPPPRLRCPA